MRKESVKKQRAGCRAGQGLGLVLLVLSQHNGSSMEADRLHLGEKLLAGFAGHI